MAPLFIYAAFQFMHYLFSFENLIIQGFIAIILFFVIEWALKKPIRSGKYRVITTLGATLILTPVICVVLIHLLIFAINFEISRDFDKSTWMSNPHDRYQMADDIIGGKILIGKDSNQVKQLLGKSDLVRATPQQWQYNMGMGGGGLGFMFHKLTVTFNADTVATVSWAKIRD